MRRSWLVVLAAMLPVCPGVAATEPGVQPVPTVSAVWVEQELNFKNKQQIEEYGIDNFIDKCKEFATKYIGVMGNQFKSLGVWMDFENPYITYKDQYIEASWSTLAAAWKKNSLPRRAPSRGGLAARKPGDVAVF